MFNIHGFVTIDGNYVPDDVLLGMPREVWMEQVEDMTVKEYINWSIDRLNEIIEQSRYAGRDEFYGTEFQARLVYRQKAVEKRLKDAKRLG